MLYHSLKKGYLSWQSQLTSLQESPLITQFYIRKTTLMKGCLSPQDFKTANVYKIFTSTGKQTSWNKKNAKRDLMWWIHQLCDSLETTTHFYFFLPSEPDWNYLVTQASRQPPPPLLPPLQLQLQLLSVRTQLETPQLPDLIMSDDLMRGAGSRTALSQVWQRRFHTTHQRLMRSSPLSPRLCGIKKETTPWL